VYSNRAACYTKLGALPEGLKDANKCIELDPKFVKGYSRKGAIQFFMKEYDKALETYQVILHPTFEHGQSSDRNMTRFIRFYC
jgi:tetratricopeptide (TPR) repeat protein